MGGRWREIVGALHQRLGLKNCLSVALTGDPFPEPPDIVALGKAGPELFRLARELGVSGRRALVAGPRGYGSTLPMAEAEWYEGAHPVPDASSFLIGNRLLGFVQGCVPGSTLLGLMSGGTSALAALPAQGVTPNQKTALHQFLIAAGLPIPAINVVRRHFSAIKGGGLLRMLLERQVTVRVLAVSDVPGDAPHDIGSGPFAPDPTTFADTLAVARTVPGFPAWAKDHLQRGVAGEVPDTLKPEEVPAGSWRFGVIAGRTQAGEQVRAILGGAGWGNEPRELPLSGSPETWLHELFSLLAAAPPGQSVLALGEAEVALPADRPAGCGGRLSHLMVLAGIGLAEHGLTAELIGMATDGCDGSSGMGAYFLDTGAAFPADLEPARRSLDRFDTAAYLREKGWAVPGERGVTNVGDVLVLRLKKRGNPSIR